MTASDSSDAVRFQVQAPTGGVLPGTGGTGGTFGTGCTGSTFGTFGAGGGVFGTFGPGAGALGGGLSMGWTGFGPDADNEVIR